MYACVAFSADFALSGEKAERNDVRGNERERETREKNLFSTLSHMDKKKIQMERIENSTSFKHSYI